MHLALIGHDYKYAVEQILLTLFPKERPKYGEEVGPDHLSASVELHCGEDTCRAETTLYLEGRAWAGRAETETPDRGDEIVWNRQMQKIIKMSFFHAAVAATGNVPPWGALTGIRPGKLAARYLLAGQSREEAARSLTAEYQVSPRRAAMCADTAAAGLAVRESLDRRDVCLYIGIPFCPTRCAYCSFVSHSVEKSLHLVEPFLQALNLEIAETAKVVRELGLRVVSIYMGGGTPTTLTGEQMSRLTGELARQFDLTHLREYTVEAGRPDALDSDKLRRLRREGVTRISINPQTMEDHVLQAIGRRHTVDDVRRALDSAREAGFTLVNMDLIAGLPADSPAGFSRTLDEVLTLGAENVTVHTLSLKKGSKITEEGIHIPPTEDVGRMLDAAGARLPQSGYVPYYLYRQKFISGGFENVGWCKPGTESLYNIAIMEELCTILALGGGGSTKLVAPETGHIRRVFNAKYPYEYTRDMDKIRSKKSIIREFYENEVFRHVI